MRNLSIICKIKSVICEKEICNFPKRNLFMICETGQKAPRAKRTNRSVHHKCGLHKIIIKTTSEGEK